MATAAPGATPPVPTSGGAGAMQVIMATLFAEWLTHLITTPQTFRGATMPATVAKILKAFPLTKVSGIVGDPSKRQALLGAVKQGLEMVSTAFPGAKNLLLRKGKEAVEALFAPNAPTDKTGWEALVDGVMGTTASTTPQPAATVTLTHPQDYVLAVKVTIGGAERCLTFPLALDATNKPVLDADGKPISYAPAFTHYTDGRNPTCVVMSLVEADRLGYVPHDWTAEAELRVALQRLQAPPAPAAPAPDPRIDQLRVAMAGYCARLGQLGGLNEILASVFGDYLEELKNVRAPLVVTFIDQWISKQGALDLTQGTISDECAHALIRLIRSDGAGNLSFANSFKHALAMAYLGLHSTFLSWPMLVLALVILSGVTSSVLAMVFWVPMFYVPMPIDLAAKRWFISLALILVPFAPLILFRETVGKIVDGILDTVSPGRRSGWGDAGRTFWWVVCWVIGISMIPLLIQIGVAFTKLPVSYIPILALLLSAWMIVTYLYRKETDIGLRNAGYVLGAATVIVFGWGMWQTHGVPWWETLDLFGSDTTGTVTSAGGSEGVATPQARGGFMPEEWFSRLQEVGGAMLCSLMSLAVLVLVGSGIFGTVLKKFGAEDAAKVVFKITSWARMVIAVGLVIITLLVVGKTGLEAWNESAPERARATHDTSVKPIDQSSVDQASAPHPTRRPPAARSVKEGVADFCQRFPTHTACKR